LFLEFLTWLEASALGEFMRESGRWTYAITNLIHVFGIALLFGAIAVLDLRLLGGWRRIPIAALRTPLVPVAATGLLIAFASGVGLMATQATEYIGNPFLLIKFGALALGLLNIAVLRVGRFWPAAEAAEASAAGRLRLASAALFSLACWITVISAGRMIGYW
jgi:hypothetical protein